MNDNIIEDEQKNTGRVHCPSLHADREFLSCIFVIDYKFMSISSPSILSIRVPFMRRSFYFTIKFMDNVRSKVAIFFLKYETNNML